MPLSSAGSACPRVLVAFGKLLYSILSHSLCNLFILCIFLSHVLASIIGPFDLFGYAFVLSTAIALSLMCKQNLSSAPIVFCFTVTNAVDSQVKW